MCRLSKQLAHSFFFFWLLQHPSLPIRQQLIDLGSYYTMKLEIPIYFFSTWPKTLIAYVVTSSNIHFSSCSSFAYKSFSSNSLTDGLLACCLDWLDREAAHFLSHSHQRCLTVSCNRAPFSAFPPPPTSTSQSSSGLCLIVCFRRSSSVNRCGGQLSIATTISTLTVSANCQDNTQPSSMVRCIDDRVLPVVGIK